MKRSRKLGGGIGSSDMEGERDPNRFYCPYPSCNRSFAELWRLKVHYRAPPDIRGSGKERGHGTELSHCPKCGKELQPGKHHVGCGSQKSTPQKPAKRIKLEHEDIIQLNGQQQSLNSDLIGVPTLWGQTLVVNQQQLAAIQDQYLQQMQQQQQLLLSLPQSVNQQPSHSMQGLHSTGGDQSMLMSPNMIPVMLGQQPGVIVLNSGLQAANYTPLVYNNNNNTPVSLTPLQLSQMPPSQQSPVQLQWMNNNNNTTTINNTSNTDNGIQQNQYASIQNPQMVQIQQHQLLMQENLQQQQQMYSEADSSQKEKTTSQELQNENNGITTNTNGINKSIINNDSNNINNNIGSKRGRQQLQQGRGPQLQMSLQNVEFKDDILGELKTPSPSLCPSPPPLPQGCDEWEFHTGQLFDFDRCLRECSKSSNNMQSADDRPKLIEDLPRSSDPRMDDVLQLLFQDDDMPFMTTHIHRRFDEEVDQGDPLPPTTSAIFNDDNKAAHLSSNLDVEESVAGSSQSQRNVPSSIRTGFGSTPRCAFVHSSGSSKE